MGWVTLRVLTVCTANVCRSVMAATLLQRHLAAAGVAAVVTSAGTQGGIVDFDPDTVEVLRESGVHADDHEPRRVSRDLLTADGADLVITATTAHLRDVAVMAPGLFKRAFTLKELARRAARLTPPARGDNPGLAAWLAALGEDRSPRDLLGDDPEDDIADPFGQGLGPHRTTLAEIDDLTAIVAMSVARWVGPSG